MLQTWTSWLQVDEPSRLGQTTSGVVRRAGWTRKAGEPIEVAWAVAPHWGWRHVKRDWLQMESVSEKGQVWRKRTVIGVELLCLFASG